MSTLGILVSVGGIVVVGGVIAIGWDVFVPKRCQACRRRQLTCVNFIRVRPGPNYATFRCRGCGEEFVQVHGRLEPRKGSKWEHDIGWEPVTSEK